MPDWTDRLNITLTMDRKKRVTCAQRLVLMLKEEKVLSIQLTTKFYRQQKVFRHFITFLCYALCVRRYFLEAAINSQTGKTQP